MCRAARREANEVMGDSEAMETAMGRTVNRMDSTALEFMTGDLDSALSRGLAQGNRDASIMAQMQAPIPAGAIRADIKLDKVPSDDPLAYTMGFMSGFQGRQLDGPQEDLADAYITGRKPSPDWIS